MALLERAADQSFAEDWRSKCRNASSGFDKPKTRSLLSYIWESRQAEPSKGVTPMVLITVKMDATTFIFVVLIVLAAIRSAKE